MLKALLFVYLLGLLPALGFFYQAAKSEQADAIDFPDIHPKHGKMVFVWVATLLWPFFVGNVIAARIID